MEVGGLTSHLGRLPPGNSPSTHFTEGWVSPRNGIDIAIKRKNSRPYQDSNPGPSSPARLCYSDSYSSPTDLRNLVFSEVFKLIRIRPPRVKNSSCREHSFVQRITRTAKPTGSIFHAPVPATYCTQDTRTTHAASGNRSGTRVTNLLSTLPSLSLCFRHHEYQELG